MAAERKRDLITAVRDAERLIRACGWPERADWLGAWADTATGLDEGSEAYEAEVARLHPILVGQGSLSDLPLNSRDADVRLWDLVDRIGELSHPHGEDRA